MRSRSSRMSGVSFYFLVRKGTAKFSLRRTKIAERIDPPFRTPFAQPSPRGWVGRVQRVEGETNEVRFYPPSFFTQHSCFTLICDSRHLMRAKSHSVLNCRWERLHYRAVFPVKLEVGRQMPRGLHGESKLFTFYSIGAILQAFASQPPI